MIQLVKSRFKIIFLLIFIISCDENKLSQSKFIGYWAGTQFEYKFKTSNEFVFTTIGHFGNTETKGKYSIIDSIILLYPYTDWGLHHGVLKNRLIFKESIGCIQDFNNNYYCKDTADINLINEREYELIEKIKGRLLKKEEVAEIRSKFPEDSLSNQGYLYFDYEGIILIDNIQYHSFQLMKKDNDAKKWYRYDTKIQYQKYLINLKENMIYKHQIKGDSISKVEKLF